METERPSKREPLPVPEPHSEIEFAPYSLSRSENEAVGRVITAVSELEQIISIALFQVVELGVLDGYTLFGSASIGKRFSQLRNTLKYKEGFSHQLNELEKVVSQITDIVNVRNMFAHGVLMGLQDDIAIYMVTNHVYNTNDNDAIMTMKRMRTSDFTPRALQAEHLVQKMRAIFDVTTLHERYVLRMAEEKARRR